MARWWSWDVLFLVCVSLVSAQDVGVPSNEHGHIINGQGTRHSHPHLGPHSHDEKGPTLPPTERPNGTLIGHKVLHHKGPQLCPLGCKGETGAKGERGPAGRRGPQGAEGAPGQPGYGGWAGWPAKEYAAARARAVKGDPGEPGPMGPAGGNGEDGLSGHMGPPGTPGAAGPHGENGDQGVAGPDGRPGAAGVTGPQGTRGSAGPRGSKGQLGLKGFEGAHGEQGARGDAGISGIPGDDGAFGIQGSKGLPGQRGIQGQRGPKGIKGAVGEKGMTGAKGSQGLHGDAGLQGLRGDAGIDGPFGEKGLPGLTGARGQFGPSIIQRAINESNPCSSATNGQVHYDRFHMKLFFCNGVQWRCVNEEQCNQPCRVSDWEPWGLCSATCGGGVQIRSRSVVEQPGPSGGVCPVLRESRSCPSLPSCECPDPGFLQNGQRTGTSMAIGATLRWACNAGYRLQGNSESICLAEYNPDQPTPAAFTEKPKCAELVCPQLNGPSNGAVQMDATAGYHSEARFMCNQGYRLRGSATLVCSDFGIWDEAPPVCVPITCRDPGTPANGGRVGSSLTYNSQMMYYCSEGYNMRGSSRTTCLSNGLFTTQAPMCIIARCGEPQRPQNGGVTTSTTTYSSTATYSCNAGYRLSGGDAVHICQANSQWSGTPPTCEIVNCGDPGNVDNAFRTVGGQTFGATASYMCNNGYVLSGNSQRRCLPSGQWSGSLPICIVIDCGNPGMPVNGGRRGNDFTLNQMVTFTCDDGYTLSGSDRRLCNLDSMWSGTQPTCEPVDCGAPPTPVNGSAIATRTTLRSQATYTCDAGFNLVGTQRRVCLPSGRWSEVTPSCILVDCGDPGIPAFGQIQAYNVPPNQGPYTYGSRVTFSCNHGYRLTGTASRTCRSCGDWSGAVPICVPMACPMPQTPSDGGTDLGSMTIGQGANFLCNPGFLLNGQQRLECRTDMQWNAESPTCEPRTCLEPRNPANGLVVSSGNTFLSTATYSCSRGYKLSGLEVLMCEENGQWSDNPPICEVLDCGNPGAPRNGRMLPGSVTTFGGAVRYACQAGYSLVGSSVRMCRDDGSWSGAAPMCVVVNCGHPGQLTNGELSGASFNWRDIVRYDCNDGYRLVGTEQRVCQDDGMWSGSVPVCIPLVCEDPGNVNHGSRLLSSLRVGSAVTYRCDTGYNLVGNEMRHCSGFITGQASWNGTLPECRIVDCGSPGALPNGILIGGSFSYGSVVRFDCEKDYAIQGSPQRTCQVNGQWSSRQPICEVIDCHDPGFPQNGRRIGDEFTYQKTVSYSCNAGYQLTGSSTQQCLANGQWSGALPVCILTSCGNPGQPLNGMRAGDTFTYGASVTYSCGAAFQLVGTNVATCGSDGTWSSAVPTCEALVCEDPGVPANGDRVMTTRTSGSSAMYSCSVGYSLVGTSTLTCVISDDGATAAWSAPLPSCRVVDCRDPGTPTNGVRSGDSYTYNQWVTFSCNAGYVMRGSIARRCIVNGTWSGSQPTCNIVMCPAIADPTSGSVTVSSFAYGGTATFSCNQGFALAGSMTASCQADGLWSGSTPTCNVINCGNPGKPAHGTRIGDVFTFGSVVTYTCASGYRLVSATTEWTCRANGRWSHDGPVCIALDCRDPGTPDHGNRRMSSSSVGSTVSYQCNIGYRLNGAEQRECVADAGGNSASWALSLPQCQLVTCPQLSPITNGRVIQDDPTAYGNFAAYLCSDGYNLRGPERRYCLASGTWTGPSPACNPVDCGNPAAVSNGNVVARSTTFGSQAVFECDTGFALQGTASRTCMASGQWSGSQPVCVVIECGNPGTPAQGSRQGNVFAFNSVVTFQCIDNYFLSGTRSLTCQANGQWTAPLPSCVLFDCRDPGIPQNGNRELGATTVGSQVTYACNTGYTLNGVRARQCVFDESTNDAAWSDSLPACQIVDCGEPGTLVNGLIQGSRFLYGNQISYSCRAGYQLAGLQARRCQANGQWSGQPPTCIILDCGNPGVLENGNSRYSATTYSSAVTFECNTGYVLRGSQRFVCQADGHWSAALPTCTLVTCPNPGAPAQGNRDGNVFTYGSQVTYSCATGYRLSGSSSARCTATGAWSSDLPSCVALTCGDPGVPNNGDRELVSTLVGSVVKYTCNVGYRLTGSDERSCLTDDSSQTTRWSSSLPTCNIISCRSPGQPANGRLIGNVFTYNAVTRFTCNAGYRLSGSSERTCLASGSWSGTPVTCTLVDCGDPGFPQHGSRTGNSFTFGSILGFSCNNGYVMSGSRSRRCQANSVWSESQPTCQVVDCGDPGTPSNGNRVGTNTTYQAEMTFTCNVGYTLIGRSTRTCLETGMWSATQPSCSAIICNDPQVPPNGFRDGDLYNLGATVSYGCNPGYALSGDQTRTCLASGEFSGMLPSCVLINCGSPGAPDNGNREGDVFTYRSRTEFSCNVGYQLTGSRMRVCQASSTWSGQTTICVSIQCEVLTSPANGNVVVSSRNYQGTAEYTCNTGYELIGESSRTCGANGLWTFSAPRCRIIECCKEEAPANGFMRGTTFTYSAVLQFSCRVGYRLIGSISRTCQVNGEWSGTQARCEAIRCSDPGLIENGFREIGSQTVGTTVTYFCNPGHARIGERQLRCLASGSWSGPVPTCQRLACSDPGSVTDGRRSGNSFSYDDSVVYTCNANYRLSGASTLRCIDVGGQVQWNFPRPSCDPNCLVSVWEQWSSCTQTCGSGLRTRERARLQAPTGVGNRCPSLQQTEACNTEPCVLCENRFPEGHIAYRIHAVTVSLAADVIIIIDESSSMASEHNWIRLMIPELEVKLRAKNIGTDPDLPNLYALVGFGQSVRNGDRSKLLPHAYVNSNNQLLFPAADLINVSRQLQADPLGSIEDGYYAIDYAVRIIPLRRQPNVAHMIIFISDEDRDTLPEAMNLTRPSIKRLLKQGIDKSIILNVIVDQPFWGMNNEVALGMDKNKSAYIYTPGGNPGYRVGVNGTVGKAFGETKRDYTGVAIELDGAAWDINQLRAERAVANAFTQAFVDVKTREISQEIQACRRCVCTNVNSQGIFQCTNDPNQAQCTCFAANGMWNNVTEVCSNQGSTPTGR